MARVIGAPASRDVNQRKESTRQTGFVAQEVEALIKKTGYVFYGVDIPKGDNDAYGIRYAEFVVPLVKAVQELSEQVSALQQELAASQKTEAATGAHKTILYQNNPNPFTSDTNIEMVISENVQQAKLIVYNLEGRQLKTIDIVKRGKTSVTIVANELHSGMYLYTLLTDGVVIDTRRMILTE